MLSQRFKALLVLFNISAVSIMFHISSIVDLPEETLVLFAVGNSSVKANKKITFVARSTEVGVKSYFERENVRRRKLHRVIDQPIEPFSLNTSKCFVPTFDPFDSAVANYFEKPITECPEDAVPLLFTTQIVYNQTCPVLNDDMVVKQSPKLDINSLQCSYREPIRDEHSARPDVSFDMSMPKPYRLGSCTPEEYIWISCRDTQHDRTYEQPLLLPKARPDRVRSGDNQVFNVLVLGIDALSRLNFLRQMRKTRQWLENRVGVVEMFGYNKIGENSAPNQIPMITGVSYIPGLMDRAIGNYFDNLTEYIWDYYKKQGFSTMFFEEQWQTGLFIHPSMQGFREVPTDYYPRALMQYIDRSDLKEQKGKKLCIGDQFAERIYLQYLIDSLHIAKRSNPLFAYAWFSELSHDHLNGARRADNDFFQFFERLEQTGLLNNTVILFLSDHGSRLEMWRGTTVGRYEDMMPYFYTILPPKLIELRPDIIDNLVVNSRRLITVYDIHATLRELATSWAMNGDTEQGHGLSLISREIPESRSCLDAGINLQFCSCLRAVRMATFGPVAKKFADFVIHTANKELVKNNVTNLCRTWTFQRIYDVFELEDPDKQFQIYKILLYAHPKTATFEASAKYKDGKFELLSRIERLDWYSSNANCVKGKDYAKYCYCKNYS